MVGHSEQLVTGGCHEVVLNVEHETMMLKTLKKKFNVILRRLVVQLLP